jgi:hypothetical protein
MGPVTNLTDGSPVPKDRSHTEIDPATGMQKGYVVLSDEERDKGFIRPVRYSYDHVGSRPKGPTRPLTAEEHARYDEYGYVEFEPNPDHPESALTGTFWTEARLKSGCGKTTKLGQALAETYARQPDFYGGTFCSFCRSHFLVGADGEFVWSGTDIRVGT